MLPSWATKNLVVCVAGMFCAACVQLYMYSCMGQGAWADLKKIRRCMEIPAKS
jgi:hypothetical protein